MKKSYLQRKEFFAGPDSYVKILKSGNVVDYLVSKHRPNSSLPFVRINKDYVFIKSTGEIKKINHKNNRSEGYSSLFRTFRNLRYLINANFSGDKGEFFVTLTYAKNQRNVKELYNDFRVFFQKFRRKFKNHNFEYIAVVEPQRTGSYHLHVLVKTDSYFYMDYDKLRNIWGHGRVHSRHIDNVTNVGAYLTSYLTNLEVDDVSSSDKYFEANVIEDGKRKKKKFLKGARLHFYENGINIYRCSRGIVRPKIIKTTLKNAGIDWDNLTYEQYIHLEMDNYENDFAYLQVNKKINKLKKYGDKNE